MEFDDENEFVEFEEEDVKFVEFDEFEDVEDEFDDDIINMDLDLINRRQFLFR